jgi:hypothetical protein
VRLGIITFPLLASFASSAPGAHAFVLTDVAARADSARRASLPEAERQPGQIAEGEPVHLPQRLTVEGFGDC